LQTAHHNPDNWNQPKLLKKNKKSSSIVPFQVGRRESYGESFEVDTSFPLMTSIFQNFQIGQYGKDQKLEIESIPGFV